MTSSVRLLSACSLAILVALALLAGVGPVAAQDTGPGTTPRLAWPITDLAGGIDDATAAQRAAQELRDRTDVQLFTLIIDTTGGVPVTDYAGQVARTNDLGVSDALYVVALEDRTYSLWLGDDLAGRVPVDRQDRIMLDAEDRLAEGDVGGASAAVADGLRETLTGGGLPVVPILLVVGAIVAGVGAWVLLRRRRESQVTAKRLEGLDREANELLLATDEQVRNATNELGFVEAMYGQAQVQPYAAAIESAKGELAQAFRIRQQLDDAEPEDPPTRERLIGEMAGHARAAQAALAEQQEAIRQLRDIERDAPKLIAALEEQLTALEARLPEADRVRASLEASYAASSWEAVRGNRTEAAKRIESARQSVADAKAAMTGQEQPTAAVEVREATQAVTEAKTLLDALDGAARELTATQARIPDEIREAATDIVTAQDAVTRSGDAASSARLSEAVALLDEARARAAVTPPDVLGALEKANAAEAIADELVAGAREAEAALARQAAMLQGAITSAQAKVEMASGYVGTRRHGVGTTPRVRVAEAQRHLDAAISLMTSDPTRALAEAQRAEQLADEAYTMASQDFDSWDDRPPTQMGGGGIDLGGVILGTIIGGMLSGGGGGGPGWGGTGWGGRGGGGGGGGGRAPMPRFPSGGMGGGGMGGGGRARGGRW